MSVDSSQLRDFAEGLNRVRQDLPELMKKLVVGEGVYAVSQAKKICKDENIIRTGNLRRSFHTDPAPRVSGSIVSIDVHNSADYASHVEYGHLAVGRGGGSLRDRRRAAMHAGRFVRGKYILTRAVQLTKNTQQRRIDRKLRRFFNESIGGG